MATVDKLQIEISASTEKAEKSIQSLISNLGVLKKSLDSVDSNKLNQTTSKLSDTMGKFSISIHNVGNSTKNMVKSFASANSSFGKSHLSIKNVVKSMSSLQKGTEKSDNALAKLASTLGKLYSQLWIFKRGISSFWKSVTSAMDYIETLNYFNASFGQVADNAVANWREMGYDSAQAYYDSFTERAGELTKKMTGFMLGSDGLLTTTGSKSLGLDPDKTMATQAQFAQMASSMGVASETAMKLSDALVEIGADLASVKNMNFADVWKDMASGMVGMSRTLDKYGVNIRNANLQTKLTELGIDATVASLSQADKALLRTIILLDSTKYAWGDLASTINAPSNQLRLLTANLHNCARMLGNIFLPVVAKVLPVVNALVIAIQRLLSAIASLLGVDMSAVFASSGAGNSSDVMSDILDEADELGDSLDDDADSAKKLKQNLLGVDELNIVSDQDAGSSKGLAGMSGLLDGAFMDALEDYQLAWDRAFDEMANKANELADKIVAFAKKIFSPISEAWGNVGADVLKAWKNAFKDLGELIKDIGSDAMAVWIQPETEKMWESIFNTVKNIGIVVDNLAIKLKEAWDFNNNGLHILENIRNKYAGIAKVAEEVTGYMAEISANLNLVPLLSAIESFTRAIGDNAYNMYGIFGDIIKRVVDFAQYLLEDFFPRALNGISSVIDRIDWETLRSNLNTIWTAIERIAEVLGGVFLSAMEKSQDIVVKFVNGNFFKRLADDFNTLATALENSKSLGMTIDAIFNFGDGRIKDFVDLFNNAVNAIDGWLKKLNTIDPNTGMKPIEQLGQRIAGAINTAVTNWDAGATGSLINDLANTALILIDKVLENVNWVAVGEKIGEMLREIEWLKLLGRVLDIIGDVIGGLIKTTFGSYLSAPLETAFVSAIAKISFAVWASKIALKIATALTGNSVVEVISKAFGKTISSSVEKAGSTVGTGGLTLGQATAGTGGLKTLGATIGKGLAVVASAEFGNQIGQLINKGIEKSTGEDLPDYSLGSFKNLGDLWSAVKDSWEMLLHDDTPWFQQIGSYIIDGICGGILAVLATPFHLAVGIFEWIVNAIKGVFGIASPAKNVMFLGEYIMLGIVEGFKQKIEAFGIAVGEFFSRFGEWFGGIGEKLEEFIGTPFRVFFTETLPQQIDLFATKISGWKDSVVQTFTEWKDNILLTVTEWATNTWNSITQWVTDTVGAIAQWYTDATNAFGDWFGEVQRKFVEWKENVIETVKGWATEVYDKVKKWASDTVETLVGWYTDATNAIKDWFGETAKKFEDWKTTVEETVDRWKQAIIDKVKQWKTDFVDTVERWKEEVKEKFETWKNNIVETVERWKSAVVQTVTKWATETVGKIKGFIDDTILKFKEWKEDIQQKFEEWKKKVVEKVEEFRDKAKEAIETFKKKGTELIERFKTETLPHIVEFAKNAISTVSDWKDKLLGFIEKVKEDGIRTVSEFVSGVKNWFSERNWTFDGIKQGLMNSFETAMNWVSQKWESIKGWFSNLPNQVFGAFGYNSYSAYTYSGYASGGFPEDGWFRASHGELIGSFDNGQTVVANNMQIIEGIQGGVERAVSSVLAPYLADIADNTRRTADKSTTVSIDGREIVTAYDSRKARNGFAF